MEESCNCCQSAEVSRIIQGIRLCEFCGQVIKKKIVSNRGVQKSTNVVDIILELNDCDEEELYNKNKGERL